jgi:RHS repeat-associated protein
VQNHYSAKGFLNYVADAATGNVLWAATAVDALGRLTAEQTGNGVVTESHFNPSTGWLMSTSSTSDGGHGTLIQKWGYGYDEVGNVMKRTREDGIQAAGSTETFTYDALDRLHTSDTTTTAGYHATDTFEHDALGNLTTKSGSTLTYGTCLRGPHAVCDVDGYTDFLYDQNGNLWHTKDRVVDYDLANRVSKIHSTPNGTSVDFVYGADGNRVVQAVSASSGASERTVYVGLGATGASLYERMTSDTKVEHTLSVYAGSAHSGPVAVRKITVDAAGSTSSTRYLHKDHLGSVTAVSDELGQVEGPAFGGADAGLMGYDPWGGRRNPDASSADASSFAPPPGNRAFTGQEAIPGVGLVNMNGRVYDPALGRFLSPDPNVQFVANLQSYNRYTYAANNPLRYTDPTGYFLGDGFDTWVNAALGIAAVAICSGAGTYAPACFGGFLIAGAIYNSLSMHYSAGMPWDSVIFINSMSTIAGVVTSGLGTSIAQAAPGLMGQIIGGAAAGAVSGFMLAPMQGGGLGEDILTGAFKGAATAAFMAAAKQQGSSRPKELDALGARKVAGYVGEAGGTGDGEVDLSQDQDQVAVKAIDEASKQVSRTIAGL